MAGLRGDELVSSLTIARKAMGVPVRVNAELATQACLLMGDDGVTRIVLRELSPEAHFAVAHELGHWALRHVAMVRPPNEEALANKIAGAICAPRRVVGEIARRGRRELTKQIRPLARTAAISQTAANLRLGEVLEDERAVLTANHQNMIVRTQGRYRWDRDELVRATRGHCPPRLAAACLTGGVDEGRFAFLAK